MITLTAKINLIENANITISGAETEMLGNNISSTLNSIVNKNNIKAKNPFILSRSKISEGTTLQNSVDYFIRNQEIHSNSITISGANIDHFTIAFDTVNNRHPKSITVDKVTYYDDDSIYTISNLSPSDSHTIYINDWNDPNYPIVITGIYVGVNIEIDYSVLKNLNVQHKESAYNDKPSYGIISNAGSMSFSDENGEIKDYAQKKLLKSDLNVEVWLNDTVNKNTQKIGSYKTSTWDYDDANRMVDLRLKDDLEEWQDIQVNGFVYDVRNPYAVLPNKSMADLYKWLQSEDELGQLRTPSKYNMLSFEELDETTQKRLTNTIIEYPMLEDGTLWQQWNKVCQTCGLYIYKNYQGRTVCKYYGES